MLSPEESLALELLLTRTIQMLTRMTSHAPTAQSRGPGGIRITDGVEGLHSEFNVRCQCYSIWEIGILEEMNIRTVLRFTVVGIVVGLVLGWLISLVSGNIFIVLAGGALGTLVGLVLGVIHRNDR